MIAPHIFIIFIFTTIKSYHLTLVEGIVRFTYNLLIRNFGIFHFFTLLSYNLTIINKLNCEIFLSSTVKFTNTK